MVKAAEVMSLPPPRLTDDERPSLHLQVSEMERTWRTASAQEDEEEEVGSSSRRSRSLCHEGTGRGQHGGHSSHHDVAAAVQGEVVGPGEGAVALSAAERFDPRVLTEVSGELVGAGEAPSAALPGTVVGFLSCVYPPVSLQVGALGVNFFTAFIVAHVDPPPLDVRRVWIDRLQVHDRPCVDALSAEGGGA